MESLQTFVESNLWLILLLVIWSLTWKGVALWVAARKGQLAWFIVLMIVNTVGILEIIYLLRLRKEKTLFKSSRVALFVPGLWKN